MESGAVGPRALLVVGVFAILAVPAAAGQMISVAPPRGSNGTPFVVRFRAPLVPDDRGWCGGTYHGEVAVLLEPGCSSKRLCPKYVAVLVNLGSFRFRVR